MFQAPLTDSIFARMRRTPVASIQDLPQEILLIICVYLHITDLFALSQVSRFFWLLLRDDLLWRNLYRSTRILRPPGPFRQQSTDFLRRALICSAKIGANWPPVKALPEFRRMVTVPMVDPAEYCHILAGRWLIAANASIACYYDLWEKPQPLPNLFYRPHLVAKFFRCVSTLNVNGDPLTFVVTETQVGIKMRRVYEPLFSGVIKRLFHNRNVGRISIDVNGPFVEPLLHYDLTQNHPGVSDVAIGARLLVIKPKGNICRIQPMIYDFRLLRPCKLAALPSNYQHYNTFYHAEYIMTRCYLLVFYSFLRRSNAIETVLLAYPIASHESSDSVLNYSHITPLPTLALSNIHVISDNSCESGVSRITLAGRKIPSCGEEATELTVLRLSLDPAVPGPGSIEYKPAAKKLLIPVGRTMLLDAGPDECGRGVYNTPSGHVVLFSVDTEHDQTEFHPSDPLPHPPTIITETAMAFDGCRGIVCIKTLNTTRNVHLEIRTFMGSTQ